MDRGLRNSALGLGLQLQSPSGGCRFRKFQRVLSPDKGGGRHGDFHPNFSMESLCGLLPRSDRQPHSREGPSLGMFAGLLSLGDLWSSAWNKLIDRFNLARAIREDFSYPYFLVFLLLSGIGKLYALPICLACAAKAINNMHTSMLNERD